ncbi:MAG: hypothetical protein AB7F50_03140 [Fimbriimonadaceae bacterium]
MNFSCIAILLSNTPFASQPDPGDELILAVRNFEAAVGAPQTHKEQLTRLSGASDDQRLLHFREGHTAVVRLKDFRVRSYRSRRQLEHLERRPRDIELQLTSEQQIRERATQLARAIGQGSGWRIDEVRTTAEKRGTGERMESYSTATVTFRRTADPPCFHGGNRMGFGIDLYDGALLHFSLTDHAVFVHEQGDVGEQRVRQVVAELLAQFDEESYPREWREPISIERGWSVPDLPWFEAYQREHARPSEVIPVFPVYKVHLAPCLEPGVPRKAWVIVRMSNGKVLHADVFGT